MLRDEEASGEVCISYLVVPPCELVVNFA